MSEETSEAGGILDGLLLGGLLGGCLRFWTADGQPHAVSVDDPTAVAALLARGRLARTSPEPRRFREMGLFDKSHGTLQLLGRRMQTLPEVDDREAVSERVLIEVAAPEFPVRPCPEPPGSQLWEAAADWFAAAFVHAAARAEFVVVEPGGGGHARALRPRYRHLRTRRARLAQQPRGRADTCALARVVRRR
jgi:hypothetical protein